MISLINAELIRLRVTRTVWLLAGIAAGLVALAALGVTLGGEGAVRPADALIAVGLAQPFAIVLGVLVLGGEFRHRGITARLLITPRRERLVAAKLIASILGGLLYGVLAVGTVLAVAVPTIAAKGQPTAMDDGAVWLGALGGVLSTAGAAGLGTGVVALLRSQTGAITGLLAWLLGGETALSAATFFGGSVTSWLKGVMPYLPGSAMSSVGELGGPAAPGALPSWAGGLVLVAWVAVFAIGGTIAIKSRDI